MSVKKAKIGRAFRLGTLELALFLLGMLFVRREIWQFRASVFYIAHWQEGLLIPLSFIDGAITGAYASRRRHVQHWPAYRKTLRWANPAFFFLYVACCALCEKLNVGQFTVLPEFWRTAGLLIVAFGMLMRVWTQMSAPAALMRFPEPPEETATATPLAAGTAGDAPQNAAVSSAEMAAPDLVASEQAMFSDDKPRAGTEDIATASMDETAGTVEDLAHDLTPIEPFAALAAPEPRPLQGEIFPVGPHKWLRHPDAAGKFVALIGMSVAFNTWIPLLALPGVFVLLKWHIADLEAFRISQLGEPYLQYKRGTWNLIPYIY